MDDTLEWDEAKLLDLASKFQENVRRYLAIAQGWSYRARYILECISVKVDTVRLDDGHWIRFRVVPSDDEVLRCIRIVEACKNPGCEDDIVSLDFTTACIFESLT